MSNKEGTVLGSGEAGKVSPFGNHRGNTMGGSNVSGGHDFLTEPHSGEDGTPPRDFTKENRPQKSGDNGANPQEIPKTMGGKVLKADPTPVSAKIAGPAMRVGSVKAPFKGMR